MKQNASSPGLTLFFLIILIVAAHFLVDTMIGIWSIYKSLAKLDMTKAGLIVAAGAFIGEGAQLFFGIFSDKGYRKHLIILGLILAIGSSFLPYTSHYAGLFCFYLVTCLGSGSFHPCAASLMSSLAPARRGLLMTIFSAGGSLGLATSQLTFTHVYTLFEGQTYLLALPSIGLALFLACYHFPQVQQIQGMISQRASLKDFVGFFKIPSLRALYFSQVANQSILWGTIFILPDVLKVLGYPEWTCYGGGHFCFILGAACMAIPGGYLADIYSERRVMLYSGLISSVCFYFILFSGGISLTILLFSLFILGATLALMNPLALSLGHRIEPTRSGAISAFLMGLVWCLSEALGPGGVGLMSRFFDDAAPVKALAVLGLFFFIQVGGTIRLPKIVPREVIAVK